MVGRSAGGGEGGTPVSCLIILNSGGNFHYLWQRRLASTSHSHTNPSRILRASLKHAAYHGFHTVASCSVWFALAHKSAGNPVPNSPPPQHQHRQHTTATRVPLMKCQHILTIYYALYNEVIGAGYLVTAGRPCQSPATSSSSHCTPMYGQRAVQPGGMQSSCKGHLPSVAPPPRPHKSIITSHTGMTLL